MQASLQRNPVALQRTASRPVWSLRLPSAPFACQKRYNSRLSTTTHVPRRLGHTRKPSPSANIRASASPKPYVGSLVATDLKFAIVIARFNDLVTKLLLEGALEAIDRHGGDRDAVDVAWVPGSFELPILAKAVAKSGKYDAVVAIGTVVRGSTTHYEAVANAAAGGLLGAGQDSGVPVIFGVLTTETMEQALDRAGGKTGNKGGEAAVTAIEMANLLKTLRKEGKAAPAW